MKKMKGLIGHLVLAIAIILAAGIVIGAVSFPELITFFMESMGKVLSFAARTMFSAVNGG